MNRTLFALALGTSGLTGTFLNTAYADGAVVSAQPETYACQTIMDLNPSQALYAACVRSLNHSLAAAYHKNVVSRDTIDVSWNPFQQACAAVGIRTNSHIFERCVVDLSISLFKLETIPGR